MRIELIEAYPIRIRAKEMLRGGTFTYDFYRSVLVRAVCDGTEGWGEAMTRFSHEATAELVEHLGRKLIGTSLPSPRQAWNRIWRELSIRGHTRGTDFEALSGIEIALFDSFARSRRVPLSRLLAKKPRRAVTVFAGSLFRSRGSIGPQVREAKKAGLSGAKVKIGFGLRKDLKILKEVRDAWPDGMLVADANCAYDARTAERACSLFGDLGLAWFEEPLMPNDWAGYIRLGRQKRVPIGAGESWFAADLGPALDAGLVDVIEPSVSRCGGVWTEYETGRLAAKRGVGFSPMTGMNSAISLAASLHVAAAVPTLAVEYNPFENPLQTELSVGLPSPSRGMIELPKGYGLGIEVDRSFVRRNAVRR